MRISVKEHSPGRMLWELLCQAGRAPIIFFNGIKQDRVVEVDDVEGWVERMQVDVVGRPVIDHSGNAVFEKVYGKVKVFLDPQE